jgi:hypothetical protein
MHGACLDHARFGWLRGLVLRRYVLRWVGDEFRPASCTTEVIGRAAVLGTVFSCGWIDLHAADGITRSFRRRLLAASIMMLVIASFGHAHFATQSPDNSFDLQIVIPVAGMLEARSFPSLKCL